ncbi:MULTISPECIES: 50S ribosomal protein L25/general stress protein Ctc [Variovorax]|jgi:large subunit ribosomal protein L25|uniref:50S ribosomal protein L25/general stress protein Ctc n=1 Tax=Variovorax TaxID=34072 RepID=UPI00086F5084|nr:MULTISPECIES: 50S ribosomal protein L25/general stress protein Ctc [Variovorax]MBN8755824.1 50S ribosomal protein L25/general stress protein Ctc [Variovorax sp.]ODU15051.1 MAG: 50S ribosomal protein L25/general stress protein Ctc [Variovorax sp. SCN 67-85]ODV23985.1 MAG: 50S ribosomal protein L25/general stress protein Ctc [Variovorax sp. SCN 67-20]OJZ10026.1 MAG: 50S ribosomal protein L25/general stress protein Ctc [Variovorax sp. 67-131]UKI06645.1 50S ribosomal protein L25/general stress 
MKFVAFERAKQGTGASRRLRISGKTPGIVYGGDTQPQLIEIDHNALWHALKKEAFHASVLEMEIGGAVSKVLLRDVQYHPFRQLVQHVDFQRVDAKTRMTMKVPVHFKGEEESEAVKIDLNLVNHVTTELELNCLPSDLPEFIEVDLSGLKKNGTVTLKDIKLPKGVKWVSHGKVNPVLASAVSPAAEEVDAPAEGAADAAAAAAPAGKGGKAPAAKTPAAKTAKK